MGLLCMVIGYHRSRNKARQDVSGDIWSVCRLCGVPMQKHYLHGWEAVANAPSSEPLDDSDTKIPPAL